MKEILRKIELNKISQKINQKGGKSQPELESILENLGYLATETTSFGESIRYIPLSIKEILLDLLYPESRVHVSLNHSNDNSFWVAEAYVYLTAEDTKPKGEGRFSYSLKEYAAQNSFSEENAVITIGNWVRGLAKTRAIQSALPFLNLYCEEEVLVEENTTPTQELPKPVPVTEKKKNSSSSASSASKKNKDSQGMEPVAIQETLSFDKPTSDSVEENAQKEKKENEAEAISLEEAFKAIVDVGNAKGHTLREVYEKRPNNIVWMYNKGGSQLKKELRCIILQDEVLKQYIKE